MKDSKKITRRRYSAELKAQVLSECARPAASVAGVALSHGINANVVHKWRRLAGAAPVPVASFRGARCHQRTSAWNCVEAQQT
jgi:transposase